MKDLVYPAVLIKDDEKGTNTGWYTITIQDLGIITEGATVVEAFVNAKEQLCALVDCAIKYGCDIESPSDFDEVYKKNKKYIVLLVDALT